MSEQIPTGEPPQASLREYLAILRLRKGSIFLITLLTVGSALYFSIQQTPEYESSTRVLVKPIQQGNELAAPTLPNLETERGLVASAPVARRVAEELELSESPTAVLGGVEVEVIPSSEFLLIKYRSTDPLEAQRRARAFAEQYLDYRRDQAVNDVLAAAESVQERIANVQEQIAEVDEQLDDATPEEQVQLENQSTLLLSQLGVLQEQLAGLTPSNISVGQVVEPATVPSQPVSPNYLMNLALAVILGLGLGVGLAFLRERLDDSLRGRGDMEARAGAPVLAVVPKVGSAKKKRGSPLISIAEPRSAAAEAYRTLRTGLAFVASQQQLKTILVTSPHPGEGKTTTVANLAVSLAQAGKRVVAVSADLRKPRLHKLFGSENGQALGLTNVLSGEVGPIDALSKPGIEFLRLLNSGPVPGNPSELLGSDRMGELLSELRQVCDFVIIDTAPILGVADPLTLAPIVDAVLLVADAENTTRGAVSQTRQQLDQVNANVVGAVLNNFDASKARGHPYYYEHYYVYRYEEPEAQRGRRRGRTEVPPEEVRRMWSS